MTKTSPSAMTRHPCQTGSGRPRPSRSCASPTSMPSTAIVRPFSANRLSRQRQHALEHGDADRQIAVEIEKCSEQIRGLNGNEFSDGQLVAGRTR